MPTAPACPQCTLENTYADGANFVCADCGFEWPQGGEATEQGSCIGFPRGAGVSVGDGADRHLGDRIDLERSIRHPAVDPAHLDLRPRPVAEGHGDGAVPQAGPRRRREEHRSILVA